MESFKAGYIHQKINIHSQVGRCRFLFLEEVGFLIQCYICMVYDIDV